MTKNRARKRAAHERASSAGESYVVARRYLGEAEPAPTATHSMNPIVRTLHEWTHRVPGVPPHVDGGYQKTRALRTSP